MTDLEQMKVLLEKAKAKWVQHQQKSHFPDHKEDIVCLSIDGCYACCVVYFDLSGNIKEIDVYQ